MALKMTVRKQSDVPGPVSDGKINPDVEALKARMAKIGAGMVLEVEVPKGSSVRSTKALITRAATQLGGAKWKHWDSGMKVYAQPVRRRRRKNRAKPKNGRRR